jgi:phosphatidylglycerophosphatase A
MIHSAAPARMMSTTPIRSAGGRTAWAWTTATFFGIGLIKPGPGTWASLVAAVVWFWVAHTVHLSIWGLALTTLGAAVAVTLIGIAASTIVERETGKDDPGHVVIDEVAGQWIALAASPVEIRHVLLGFTLFRLFDIVKPWPARQLERLHGGFGIMMDDVAAGIYALLVGLVIHHWW